MTENDENVRQFFADNDQLARRLGIELLEAAPGRAVARLPVTDHHLNGVGTVHGGALFSLADVAFAAAVNAHGRIAVALNVNMSFIKATRSGVLTATCSEMSLGRTVGTYQVEITNDDGDPVAYFHGTAFRLKDALPLDPPADA